MSSERVVILASARTPIGVFNGRMSKLSAHELGAIVIKEAMVRASVEPDDISEVIFGQVLTACAGQNPARQAAMAAEIPYTVPATLVNMLCGSGLRSVVMGCQSLLCGDSRIVVCGGQESMSRAPHAMMLRTGVKMGPATLTDTMTHDGLTDAFNDCHMGITAEHIAKRWNLTRDEQDLYAVTSQQKAQAAQEAGHFLAEIVPVMVPKCKELITDEYPTHGSTMQSLAKLKPCFIKNDTGTVTAGNSSGINDGAAALVITTETQARNLSTSPIATIVSWAQAGVDPSIMGTGPIPAVREALRKADWTIDDVEVWELNEAFAAQCLAVVHELGIDQAKVNLNGGAIALGHPIGASGARILVTLLHILQRTGKRRGVAALCVGGGMGIAMCIEGLNY